MYVWLQTSLAKQTEETNGWSRWRIALIHPTVCFLRVPLVPWQGNPIEKPTLRGSIYIDTNPTSCEDLDESELGGNITWLEPLDHYGRLDFYSASAKKSEPRVVIVFTSPCVAEVNSAERFPVLASRRNMAILSRGLKPKEVPLYISPDG